MREPTPTTARTWKRCPWCSAAVGGAHLTPDVRNLTMTRNPNASFTPRVIAAALVAQNGPVDACRKLNAVVRQGGARDAATLDRCREAHAIILAANGWLDRPNGWEEWFAASDAATPAVRRLCLDLLLDAGSDLLNLSSPDIEV